MRIRELRRIMPWIDNSMATFTWQQALTLQAEVMLTEFGGVPDEIQIVFRKQEEDAEAH